MTLDCRQSRPFYRLKAGLQRLSLWAGVKSGSNFGRGPNEKKDGGVVFRKLDGDDVHAAVNVGVGQRLLRRRRNAESRSSSHVC